MINLLKHFGIKTDSDSKDKWLQSKFIPIERHKYKMINPAEVQLVEHHQSPKKVQSIKESGEINKPIDVFNKYASTNELKNDTTKHQLINAQDNKRFDVDATKYQLIDGHHRTLAAIERGDKTIPAIIWDDPKNTIEWRKRKGYQT
jgi:hypothetical protein